jgi:hypothetical protein
MITKLNIIVKAIFSEKVTVFTTSVLNNTTFIQNKEIKMLNQVILNIIKRIRLLKWLIQY